MTEQRCTYLRSNLHSHLGTGCSHFVALGLPEPVWKRGIQLRIRVGIGIGIGIGIRRYRGILGGILWYCDKGE